MSIPKEPRQMMINMMYLVLTALLALNVSAEVLNAFHVVNEGITHSTIAVDKKNELTMTEFERQNVKDPGKTQALLTKAKKAKQLADELTQQIQGYTDLIVAQSGGWVDNSGKRQAKGWSPEAGELRNDNDLDASTHIMMDEGRAAKLKGAIMNTRAQLLSLIDDPGERKLKEEQLPIRIDKPHKGADGIDKTWEEANFQMVPTIASVTLLNKFQNDAKNSEAQIIDYLFDEIYEHIQKVDTMEAKIVAPSAYVMAGQDYKADIFVAAYSKSLVPKVLIGQLSGVKKDKDGNYPMVKQNPVVGGGKSLEVVGGVGKYDVKAGGQGQQSYTGAIMVQDADGHPNYYPFEASYISAKGSAVISSDNLNLIYAGIPNPFSISVPGFDASKVLATATSGSLSGAQGKYQVNMPGTLVGKTVRINVSVKADAGTLSISSQEFKVKMIPNPVAKLAGKTDGSIKAGELKISAGPNAMLENFYFQGIQFTITSYDFAYLPRQDYPFLSHNNSQLWSKSIEDKIKAAKPGDRIVIQNIKAVGPDKITRSLNPITLEIK